MRGWRARRPETTPVPRWWNPISARLAAFFDGIAAWQERRKTRHELLSLDDRALRDIGVDRATAHYLGGLPFWHE